MKVPSFKIQCISALCIRLILIIYGDFHDSYFSVPYTDIDYNVYTDAARLLLHGKSPYERHTYRYTPLLALILTPNVLLYQNFGKIFFSIIDVVIGIMIRDLLKGKQCSDKVCNICTILWLYCPLTIVISTRGNADAIAVLLVLLTLINLSNDKSLTAGIVHGISVHFRLYPMAFSLAMYLALSINNNVIPNGNQLKLVFGCVLSLGLSTLLSYYYYGYKFLYESLIYHLIRKDVKHNFSLYFYMQYLSIEQPTLIIEKLVPLLPPAILLIALSFRYCDKKDLPFAMLTQTLVMVTYNSVITSQYFFWYISLLPLCVPYIQMSITKLLALIIIWIVTQAFWLYDAYFLEFHGTNTFDNIWLASLMFFTSNIKILKGIIDGYDSKLIT